MEKIIDEFSTGLFIWTILVILFFALIVYLLYRFVPKIFRKKELRKK
jgi:uncharacterized BrkB/YihY/UPF0761 family membrane protein